MIAPCVADAFVKSCDPDTNFGHDVSLRIGSQFDPAYECQGIKRAFLRFDTSSVPPWAVVSRVVLEAYQSDLWIGQGLDVYAGGGAWSESDVTWMNQPGIGPFIGTMSLVSQDVVAYETPGLVALVQQWVEAGPNNGLALRFYDESVNDLDTALLGDTLAARENAGLPSPRLVVTYDDPWEDLGHALAGASGLPALLGTGALVATEPMSLELTAASANRSAALVVGFTELSAPFKGGTLVPNPDVLITGLPTGPTGSIVIPSTWPPGFPPGFTTYFQYWITDAAGPKGFSASNGLSGTTP